MALRLEANNVVMKATVRHIPVLRRLVRYASVSAISTATSLSVLGALVGLAGMPGVLSNFVATAVGTVPSFELNRRWVWSRAGRPSFVRQVVPFCALAFTGLLVSSVAVHFAGAATATSSRLLHTSAVELANVASYGALWALQFFLCDKVFFRSGGAAGQAGGKVRRVIPADEDHVNLLSVASGPQRAGRTG